MNNNHLKNIAAGFVAAFDSADLAGIAAHLADDLVADVTEADGSTRQVRGRDAYMASIKALDIPTVRPSVKATQIAEIDHDQVMVMVEIQANRKGRTLHNFAAHLFTIREGRICRAWMVEALPAESDAFWK